MNELYRQGDVLLIRVTSLPHKVKTVERDSGRVVLAYGEATGHHHSIVDAAVELFETADTVDRWLKVGKHGTVLTHQEHATIELPEGIYRVSRQREYAPEAIRNVAD